MEAAGLEQGRIVKLAYDRGFGFILVGSHPHLFFHRSDVEGVEFDALREAKRSSTRNAGTRVVAASTRYGCVSQPRFRLGPRRVPADNAALGPASMFVARRHASETGRPESSLPTSVEQPLLTYHEAGHAMAAHVLQYAVICLAGPVGGYL